MNYTRATAAFEPPTGSIEAAAVLEAAIANLRGPIEENQASVTHGMLPTVRMHSAHLLQVFQNLISNAIKYRRPETPRISVIATARLDEYVFTVQDNGVGIAPEALRSVFRMFKRLHVREREGTGIGLAICERIVENYGGRIWVESEVGRGSTFFFTIPR
jgi:light-regulated signal transduction histidine kinase (bacteriophytochrome)